MSKAIRFICLFLHLNDFRLFITLCFCDYPSIPLSLSIFLPVYVTRY